MRNDFLWTAFNVYFVNLLLANFLMAICLNLVETVNNLYSRWPLSFNACTFLNYGRFCIGGLMYWSHALITLDRLWSVLLPVHYRTYRSVKTLVVMCGGMWVYVHVILLPGVIQESIFYRLPLETNQCFFNSGMFDAIH